MEPSIIGVKQEQNKEPFSQSKNPWVRYGSYGSRGDVAQEVELSSGSRRVAGSIPPWACQSVPEQDT